MSTMACEWELWSTTARLVVTDPTAIVEARAVCDEILADIDRAANRFDPTSEISTLADDGAPQQVSVLLAELIAEALGAAATTGGAVDPTVGATLVDLGYDRDISLIQDGDRWIAQVRKVRGWQCVDLDGTTLTLPAGVLLDLGATAKAGAADRCARAVAARFGTGALVALGGDIATAGRAPGAGWQIAVQDLPTDPPAQIMIPSGWGVSTSSTRRRTWHADGTLQHHLIDPRTSRPVADTWGAVTVVARTCVAANTASTAAIVQGTTGAGWLRRIGLPARAIAADGHVTLFGAWPQEAAA